MLLRNGMRETYLESEDFWLDEVDGRAVNFDEAFAGFAVGYCGGSLHVNNELLWEGYFLLAKGLHCFSHGRKTLSVTWLLNAMMISLWCTL